MFLINDKSKRLDKLFWKITTKHAVKWEFFDRLKIFLSSISRQNLLVRHSEPRFPARKSICKASRLHHLQNLSRKYPRNQIFCKLLVQQNFPGIDQPVWQTVAKSCATLDHFRTLYPLCSSKWREWGCCIRRRELAERMREDTTRDSIPSNWEQPIEKNWSLNLQRYFSISENSINSKTRIIHHRETSQIKWVLSNLFFFFFLNVSFSSIQKTFPAV